MHRKLIELKTQYQKENNFSVNKNTELIKKKNSISLKIPRVVFPGNLLSIKICNKYVKGQGPRKF